MLNLWVIRRSLHIDKNQKHKFHSYNKSLCKTFDLRGRAIFGPRGIILTNLVEVH